MDYQNIYNQIIERGKFRVSEERVYYEIHHIVPKCMGGGEEEENKVKLEAREHFLCHWLLCRIYPDNTKLIQAFWLMACIKREQYKYFISSKMYEEAKLLFINSIKGNKKRGEKISQIKQNKTLEEKEKTALNYSNAFKNISPEEKIFIAKKKRKTWYKNYIKNAKKIGENHEKLILQYDKNWNFIKEWPSINEANKILHCDCGGFLLGKQKTAGNSFWKYKGDLLPLEQESLTSFYC